MLQMNILFNRISILKTKLMYSSKQIHRTHNINASAKTLCNEIHDEKVRKKSAKLGMTSQRKKLKSRENHCM